MKVIFYILIIILFSIKDGFCSAQPAFFFFLSQEDEFCVTANCYINQNQATEFKSKVDQTPNLKGLIKSSIERRTEELTRVKSRIINKEIPASAPIDLIHQNCERMVSQVEDLLKTYEIVYTYWQELTALENKHSLKMMEFQERLKIRRPQILSELYITLSIYSTYYDKIENKESEYLKEILYYIQKYTLILDKETTLNYVSAKYYSSRLLFTADYYCRFDLTQTKIFQTKEFSILKNQVSTHILNNLPIELNYISDQMVLINNEVFSLTSSISKITNNGWQMLGGSSFHESFITEYHRLKSNIFYFIDYINTNMPTLKTIYRSLTEEESRREHITKRTMQKYSDVVKQEILSLECTLNKEPSIYQNTEQKKLNNTISLREFNNSSIQSNSDKGISPPTDAAAIMHQNKLVESAEENLNTEQVTASAPRKKFKEKTPEQKAKRGEQLRSRELTKEISLREEEKLKARKEEQKLKANVKAQEDAEEKFKAQESARLQTLLAAEQKCIRDEKYLKKEIKKKKAEQLHLQAVEAKKRLQKENAEKKRQLEIDKQKKMAAEQLLKHSKEPIKKVHLAEKQLRTQKTDKVQPQETTVKAPWKAHAYNKDSIDIENKDGVQCLSIQFGDLSTVTVDTTSSKASTVSSPNSVNPSDTLTQSKKIDLTTDTLAINNFFENNKNGIAVYKEKLEKKEVKNTFSINLTSTEFDAFNKTHPETSYESIFRKCNETQKKWDKTRAERDADSDPMDVQMRKNIKRLFEADNTNPNSHPKLVEYAPLQTLSLETLTPSDLTRDHYMTLVNGLMTVIQNEELSCAKQPNKRNFSHIIHFNPKHHLKVVHNPKNRNTPQLRISEFALKSLMNDIQSNNFYLAARNIIANIHTPSEHLYEINSYENHEVLIREIKFFLDISKKSYEEIPDDSPYYPAKTRYDNFTADFNNIEDKRMAVRMMSEYAQDQVNVYLAELNQYDQFCFFFQDMCDQIIKQHLEFLGLQSNNNGLIMKPAFYEEIKKLRNKFKLFAQEYFSSISILFPSKIM